MFLPLLSIAEKINRVIKIEQKSEVRIPMINVVAKPCTGPVPKTNSTIPVIKVVKLPSMMADIAFLKPSLRERAKPLPARSSSLTRS